MFVFASAPVTILAEEGIINTCGLLENSQRATFDTCSTLYLTLVAPLVTFDHVPTFPRAAGGADENAVDLY